MNHTVHVVTVKKTDDLILTDITKEFVDGNEGRQNVLGQY